MFSLSKFTSKPMSLLENVETKDRNPILHHRLEVPRIQQLRVATSEISRKSPKNAIFKMVIVIINNY